MSAPWVLALLTISLVMACGPGEARENGGSRAPQTIVTGLHVPWGIAFLPGGDALVSERTTGRILRISSDGSHKRVVMRLPAVDTGAGEGGLLGLTVSPPTVATGSSTPTSRAAGTTASSASASAGSRSRS